MEQGKSSPASIAGNPVTLHEIVARKNGLIKDSHAITKAHHMFDKTIKKKEGTTTLSEESSTTEIPNNMQLTGCQESRMNMMM
jgi:hypothetical protein